MTSVPAIVVLVLTALLGVLVVSLVSLVRRRRRRMRAKVTATRSGALPRVQLRSQMIVLTPSSANAIEREEEGLAGELPSAASPVERVSFVPEEPSAGEAQVLIRALDVHEKPTIEFSAHIEELAALSRHSTPTREFSVHDARTREFAAYQETVIASEHRALAQPSRAENDSTRAASGLQPHTRIAHEQPGPNATLSERARAEEPHEPTAAELLGMLSASPTPDLGNIEIYYRLGLVYLADGNDAEARRCFLNVEGVSPGYRDAAEHLARAPSYAPRSSRRSPVHHVVTSSGVVPAQQKGASSESEPVRTRHGGRRS